MSVFHSNSTHTIEIPAEEEERTRLTLVAPFTEVSMGNVTSFSTSSGAIPCASVSTTTVGAVKSGNTSTSILEAITLPKISNKTDAIITKNRFCSENLIILLSIY